MQTEPTKKLFTVDDYYRMAEVGILPDDVRVELVGGEIIEMTAMGALHAAAVTRFSHLIVPPLKGKALVRPQLPLRLDDLNEPEPDIAVLKPRSDFYSSGHPGSADVFLVVEIADTSLRYDRDVKALVYAVAAIPELWILDLQGGALLVFRKPSDKGFESILTLPRGSSVSPLAFPEIIFPVDDILG
jgi:Uma2 family endonuclease